MTTICANCRLIRPENTEAPAWQCPGCGVAYIKAGEARSPAATWRQQPAPVTSGTSKGIGWGKWLTILALAWGAYVGFQAAHKKGLNRPEGIGSIALHLGGNTTAEQLASLAARTQPGDVLMYSADWCPNCREAKGWMDQYGFKYEICDIEKGAGCLQQIKSLGGDGVPYLIVKGHHMKDGFDSEEFVAALSMKQ